MRLLSKTLDELWCGEQPLDGWVPRIPLGTTKRMKFCVHALISSSLASATRVFEDFSR